MPRGQFSSFSASSHWQIVNNFTPLGFLPESLPLSYDRTGDQITFDEGHHIIRSLNVYLYIFYQIMGALHSAWMELA